MEGKENPKSNPLLSLMAVFAMAGTIFDVINSFAGFMDILNEQGTEAAMRSLIRPAMFAALAIILSISYLLSSRKAKKAADGEGASGVGTAVTRLLYTVTKSLLVIFIIGIIGCSLFLGNKIRTYMNRPELDVSKYVDLSETISGYDGYATFDESKVKITLPESVKEFYSESGSRNYDNNEAYTEEEEEWYRFVSNIVVTVDGFDKTGLTNDDKATVTVHYNGNDLSDVKGKLHIRIVGLDEPQEYTVEMINKLPHRFEDQAQAKMEKEDVVTAAAERLKNDMQKSSSIISYEYVCLFCKPEQNADNEPDALVIVGNAVENDGLGGEKHVYKAACIFPFDSNSSADIVSGSGNWDYSADEQFVMSGTYESDKELVKEIVSGRLFGSNVEYSYEKIPVD